MKRRVLCLLLVLCMLLPVSAFALGQEDGAACFDYLKNYLQTNGTFQNGVYTYEGLERSASDDGVQMIFHIFLTYDPAANALTFANEASQDQQDNAVFFRSAVTVPASLRMPYDAVERISVLGQTYFCTAKIASDFTTQSRGILEGEDTFGTEALFPYTVALAFRHVQDNLLTAAGYPFSALGLTALYDELYPSEPCDGGDNCPSKVFTDVNRTLWYHLPIDWAVTTGVTNGTSKTTFSPNASCTRAQMVTFLWRAKGEPEPKLQTSKFVDVPADQYYTKAVLWAVENGITDGVDATHFAPGQTVTRAQTVTFLWRMMGKPVPQSSQTFPDVPSGEYYSDAVAWAVENEITNGMNGVFAPKNDCTRAQIVTFLYRTIVK